MSGRAPIRLAIVCSHPIQYLSPWFRHLAAQSELELTVLYGDDHGVRSGFDPEFKKDIRWDVDLLSGYRSLFLRNHAPRPGVGRFFGILSGDLFRHLDPRSFDAVLIQGWNYALYPLALFFAKTARLPVLLRCESVLLQTPSGRSHRATLKRALLGRYLSACAAALAVSSANRRLLLHYGLPPARVFSSPYAVDGQRFALPNDERQIARARLRKQLGVAEQTPLLLFSGKLLPVKAPELLLSAFAALRKRGVFAHLCLCGDGPLHEKLRAQAQTIGDVSFTGFVNQAEMPALYAAADALILPSMRETFGIVVAEAMHADLPVVVSSGVGCAEDLVGPENGLVFPVGDECALLDCLRTLCEGDGAVKRRAALSQGARRRISRWTYAEATAGLLSALHAIFEDGIR